MMHGCASVSEAPRRGPILLCGMKAMLQRAGDRRLEPSSAIRYVRIKPKLSVLLSVTVHWISRPARGVSITPDA